VLGAIYVGRDERRILAFIKRLLETLSQGSAALAAGGLFLVSEVCRSHPLLLKQALASSSSSSPLTTTLGEKEDDVQEAYDPNKREPSFAIITDLARLWELSFLRSVSQSIEIIPNHHNVM